jgi:DNA-binding HxlR family transcriptional regulator
MSELEVFGASCLDLLADEATVIVLAHLRTRAMSAIEIGEATPGLSNRVLLSRLDRLASHGLVGIADQRQREGGLRRVSHHLLASGQAILTVVDAAAGCEAQWPQRPRPFAPLGTEALAVAADRQSRAIARALASGRLRLRELETLLPEIAHGTLERRLRERGALGLLSSEREGREAWHSLTDIARRLARVALHAARWEWTFGKLDAGSRASDLAGLIHQLAPLARLPKGVNGICLLREDWHATLQSDIYLAARGGRLAPFVTVPLERPDATAQGTPEQWAQALVTDEPAGITCTGSRALLRSVIAGLGRELSA